MVEIRPFRGYHYNMKKLSIPPEKLFAPPYDVISNELLEDLKSEPLNIAHLTLGDRNNNYANASELLRDWIADEKIIAEDKECFFVFEQTFDLESRQYTRTGLIALNRITPLGGDILPHEKTHPKAKEDRLENLKALRGNLEQIFMIYDDQDDSIGDILRRARQPENEIISFIDFDSVRNRVFRICRDDDISAITQALEDKKGLIADGHHRYETALTYSQIMDEKNGPGPHDFILTTFVNARDSGLIMLSTHRILYSLDQSRVDSLPEKLSVKFDVERIDDRVVLSDRLEADIGCSTIGFWLPRKTSGILATLKAEYSPKDPLRRSDVMILHELVLEEIFDITPEMQERREKMDFVMGTEEALKRGDDSSSIQVVCLLNAPSIPEVMEIAERGEKMPHKSTYFYPKLSSGVIMNFF